MKRPFQRARKICLSFPDAAEKEAWGEATFRRGKMFAMFADNHHNDGRIAMWLRAADGVQEILVGAAPNKFFVPPYMGPSGWIGVCLDGDVDWDEVTDLVREAYELTAPSKAASKKPRRAVKKSVPRRAQK
jgi:predicted DNA-binding protein (MmcQ/YjbR family)